MRRIVPAARPWFASIRLCSSDASAGDVMSHAPLSEFLVLSRGRWDEDLSEDEIQAAIDAFYAWPGGLVDEGKVRVGQRLKRATRRVRSAEHTSELQPLMRNSNAGSCLNKNKKNNI